MAQDENQTSEKQSNRFILSAHHLNPSQLILPSVLRRKPQLPLRLLNREQRIILPLRRLILHPRESRLNQLLIPLPHTSILRRNQILMVTLQATLQRLRNALPTVASINISPAIPVPRHGILLPTLEIRVLGGQHDITEAQRDDFRLRVPAAELVRQSFADEFGEGVSALGAAFVFLSNRQGSRRVRVERNANKSLRRSENNIRNPQLPASFQHVISAHRVRPELPAAVRLARRRDRRQVDDGVDAAVRHVDRHEGLEDGAHVFEVDFDESVGAAEAGLAVFARGGRAASVDRDDLPAFVREVFHCCTAEFTAAACDDDAADAVAAFRLAQGEFVCERRGGCVVVAHLEDDFC
jgi:hypothetical protein